MKVITNSDNFFNVLCYYIIGDNMKKLIITILSILAFSSSLFFINKYYVSLNGEDYIDIGLNDKYNDEGVEVYRLGKVIKNVITESNVDTSKIGSYLVNYVVNDRVIKKRHVNVVDNVRPVIELLGDKIVTLEIGQEYLEDGYIVSDNIDKDIDSKVKITNNIDYNKIGKYEITYSVIDFSNNETVIKRLVNIEDKISPEIKLNRNINSYSIIGKEIDLSYSAIDNLDGDITSRVEVDGNVDFNKKGLYYITYKVSDSFGNETILETTVNVQKKNTKGIPVLMYHWFYDDTLGEKPGEANAHNYISKTALEKQLKFLKKNNYYYPTWEELEQYIDGKINLPEKSVIITDDDGTSNFYKVAVPLFQKYKIPVTSFVITSKKAYKKMFNQEYLDLQSHTNNMHKRVCKGVIDGKVMCSSYEDIDKDIKTSIEKLGNDVTVFAYPFGHYNNDTIKALKNNGIKLAFTIEDGRVKKGQNKYKLPRVRISSWTSISAFEGLLK